MPKPVFLWGEGRFSQVISMATAKNLHMGYKRESKGNSHTGHVWGFHPSQPPALGGNYPRRQSRGRVGVDPQEVNQGQVRGPLNHRNPSRTGIPPTHSLLSESTPRKELGSWGPGFKVPVAGGYDSSL